MAELKTYTLTEVADILHITTRTLYSYIKAGKLKAVKVGRSWRVTEEALNGLLASGV